MKQEIKLHESSYETIKDVFSMYEYVEETPEMIDGKIVLHLYPICDTVDESGDLIGFNDAVFFKLRIYDVEKRVFYEQSHHDEICLDGLGSNIRIFKDLSTMIIIGSGVKLVGGTSFLIIPK